MDITVVIPTYNRETLIPFTLDAVLAQSVAPAEIIVVDDGSQDGTAELMSSRYPHIRYLRNENAGPSIARFEAVQAASSDWIAFCDSDDIWDRNHLATIQEAIEQLGDVDVLFTNFVNFTTDPGRVFFDQFDSMPAGWWSRWSEPAGENVRVFRDDCLIGFLDRNPVFPSALIARRQNILAAGRPDATISRLPSEDGDLTRKLVSSGRTAAIECATVKIRVHEQNLSANKLAQRVSKAAALAHTCRSNEACFEHFMPAIERARDAAFAEALRHALWRREWPAAAALFGRGVKRFNAPIERKYYLAGACLAAGRRWRLISQDRAVDTILDRVESHCATPVRELRGGGTRRRSHSACK
jgi:glycosyltransferase involved in cell wall biosynthesis